YTRKHHRVKNNWYTPTIDFVYDTRRLSSTHSTFSLVEGNLKILEGHWDFQPAPGGGLVVRHEIRIRSKFPAPRWLVRRVLKNDLPDMLACVRGLARGSGDAELLARDLGRCPGDVGSLDN
ncbi:MAG: SRPBCC family protein, partial [Lysobacterales bacterium]